MDFAIYIVSPADKASAVGWFSFPTGISVLITSRVAGLPYAHVGQWSAFTCGAAGVALTEVLMLVLPVFHIARKTTTCIVS
jgi:hypothetical protein